MSLDEAIGLLLRAAEQSIGGEIFVMKMSGVRILDLAEVMIKELGNKNTKIKEIGIRPGEKIDELLVSPNEVERTIDFGDYYIIMPYVPIKKVIQKYQNKKRVDFKFYSSANTELLSPREIRNVLKRNNFLKKGYKYEELISSLDKETLKRLAKDEKWLI